ncbi:DNA topoisomerase IV subunit B, partial [Candidatus Curtissbacteria bacterium]|nr:DNA topoisomerase IV subunit B [Candidatus Curtissbacteria bacterium]
FHMYDMRNGQELHYYFDGGIESLVRHLNKDKTAVNQKPFYVGRTLNEIMVEASVQYNEGYAETIESFANVINTAEGGTHLTGFRMALTRAVNDYARKNGYLKEKDDNLTGDDMREGLTAVVAIKMNSSNLQFEGQTKGKLGNAEVQPAVNQVVKDDPAQSEIYLVEGDSAGGSAKMGRDRKFQAILPLRGKILNSERARLDKVLEFEEIKTLIIAIGAGIGDTFNIEKARYHRIVLMTDADVDGEHITTLLLTFIFRYLPQLIEKGYVYIAMPPLYKVSAGRDAFYVYTEEEKDVKVKEIGPEKTIGLQRYKGLGEMNPEQLWETTMNPATRIMKQITIEDASEADRVFSMLMGDEVPPRKRFIQTHAKAANLDI